MPSTGVIRAKYWAYVCRSTGRRQRDVARNGLVWPRGTGGGLLHRLLWRNRQQKKERSDTTPCVVRSTLFGQIPCLFNLSIYGLLIFTSPHIPMWGDKTECLCQVMVNFSPLLNNGCCCPNTSSGLLVEPSFINCSFLQETGIRLISLPCGARRSLCLA